MSLPNEVIVSTSKLTAIGDAIRSRFGVSGELTLDEMATVVTSHLPSNFQQVDYVEATGSQYIVANLNANGYDIEFQYTSGYSDDAIFGSRTNYNNGNRMGLFSWNGGCDAYLDKSGGNNISLGCQAEQTYRVRAGQKFDNKLLLDDTELASNITTNANVGKIALFQMWEAKTNSIISGYHFHGRIYYLTLYNGNNTVAAFIPCYRKSDNVIGMYDIINGQFYTNAGSGSFTCYPAPPSN